MHDIAEEVKKLKRGDISRLVKKRMVEFKENKKYPDKIFSELCFCICTANNSAERGLRAQEEIDFCRLPEADLRKAMKKVVCRFYNHKTDYVLAARSARVAILKKVKSANDGKELREWIVTNVTGLGYKEASHFLRNIGFEDLAIIDFHIVDFLVKNGVIKRPKTLTCNNYLKIEERLAELADKTKTSLAELDLYLWYLETGKVLK